MLHVEQHVYVLKMFLVEISPQAHGEVAEEALFIKIGKASIDPGIRPAVIQFIDEAPGKGQGKSYGNVLTPSETVNEIGLVKGFSEYIEGSQSTGEIGEPEIVISLVLQRLVKKRWLNKRSAMNRCVLISLLAYSSLLLSRLYPSHPSIL